MGDDGKNSPTAFPGTIGKTIKESTPHWPAGPKSPAGAPNILIVLFDDVGFSDFGCYGSPIATPAIDRIAAQGLRYTGFHTTAMCSTTRAALLTGRNHHSVGMGCLANFDSGYPGYRGKIAREAGTLAEMLGANGYRNYMVGKWHVTPVFETGPTGPFDGWPLARGFDRYYGFMDAETDQYAPELVADNTHIDAPGTYETGYHLTSDLIDQSIKFIADHIAGAPQAPWLTWVALGACHAPHQAPRELILKYDALFQHGWDVERERRLARQIEMGVVPAGTVLPPRNDGVVAWETLGADERKVFCRLQGAYAAMLEHADQHIARLMAFLEKSGQADNTLVLVLSDNGASQEGFIWGMVNAMGPYNAISEPMPVKLARIDDIGGPNSHSNFPWGWAMTSNTPLKRYKQNTHGGGIRDPLVLSWPKGVAARGALRHQFCHASDLTPTLIDVIGISAPESISGVPQQPLEGESFAASLRNAAAPQRKRAQYFEMFGHRGLWHEGWKAVAFHPPGTPFEGDKWELYHLDQDFAEVHDLAEKESQRLQAMIARWWQEAAHCQVLPLDDRFGPRFAENAARVQGHRNQFVFYHGMGHVPTDVAPDVRSRSYLIEADVEVSGEGVLIAHGDMTSGYSLYVQDARLVHDLNIGGSHQIVRSERKVPSGKCRLGFRMRRIENKGTGTLLIDGEPAGEVKTNDMFRVLISWSGLDIGRDRGSPVSHYTAPFAFTGKLNKVTVTIGDDQALDGAAAGRAEMARQ